MASDLQYTIEKASNINGITILSLSGEIDENNQGELEKVMNSFIEDPSIKYVVVKLQNLEYVNSGVIGLFATMHGGFQDSGKDFVFAEANDNIFDIIDLVGLTTVITLFGTVEEACVSFED